jgi:hypothetical protein
MMLREPWRTRLLFLSFAVNLVTLPLAASHVLMMTRHHPHPAPGPPRTSVMVRHISHDLPTADAKRFRAVLMPRTPDIEVARAKMEAAKTAMARVIGRDPYDPAAVAKAMHDWQLSWLAWSGILGQGILAALPELSPQGRHQLSVAGQRER